MQSQENVQEYFNSHNHGYNAKPADFDELTHTLKNRLGERRVKVLDIGCGNGSFIKSLIDNGVNAQADGIDQSQAMLDMAREKLAGYEKKGVNLILVNALDLPTDGKKYDVIRMGNLLHHLIGRTRKESVKLCETLLNHCVKLLDKNGIIIIEEIDYSSYVIPSFTTRLIFYGLKFLNKTKIDLSGKVQGVQLGLEVNFFPRSELLKLLSKYSDDVELWRVIKWPVPRLYKLLLLKEFSKVSFFCRMK